MLSPADLNDLNSDQLRALATTLMAQVSDKDRELVYRQTRIDQLTHEISLLKRHQLPTEIQPSLSEMFDVTWPPHPIAHKYRLPGATFGIQKATPKAWARAP